MLEIMQCSRAHVPAVMRFIDEHWRSGHVLSVDRRLMDWQYGPLGCEGDKYNWVVAVDGDDIVGVLGFIPTSRYDPTSGNNIIWIALWRVKDSCGHAGLGLRMLKVLEDLAPHNAIGVVGINPDHPPMYKALGFSVAEMNHYVLFSGRAPLLLAHATKGMDLTPAGVDDIALDLIFIGSNDIEQMWPDDAAETWINATIKTPRYFRARYLEHPFYSYRILAVMRSGRPLGYFACREAEFGGARALRIVDFCGCEDAILYLGARLRKLLLDEGLEYADIWESGIDRRFFSLGGFIHVPQEGDLVVPNYFEPFVRANARIQFALKGLLGGSLSLMRADGDQDRPNVLVPGPA